MITYYKIVKINVDILKNQIFVMMTITHKVKQEKRFYDIDEGKHVSER